MLDGKETKSSLIPVGGTIGILIGIIKVAQMEARNIDSHWTAERNRRPEEVEAIKRDAKLFLEAVNKLARSKGGFEPLDLATMIKKDEYIGHIS